MFTNSIVIYGRNYEQDIEVVHKFNRNWVKYKAGFTARLALHLYSALSCNSLYILIAELRQILTEEPADLLSSSLWVCTSTLNEPLAVVVFNEDNCCVIGNKARSFLLLLNVALCIWMVIQFSCRRHDRQPPIKILWIRNWTRLSLLSPKIARLSLLSHSPSLHDTIIKD